MREGGSEAIHSNSHDGTRRNVFNSIFLLITIGAARTGESDDVRLPDVALLIANGRPRHLHGQLNRYRRPLDSLLIHFQDISRGGYQDFDVYTEEIPSRDFRCLQVRRYDERRFICI